MRMGQLRSLLPTLHPTPPRALPLAVSVAVETAAIPQPFEVKNVLAETRIDGVSDADSAAGNGNDSLSDRQISVSFDTPSLQNDVRLQPNEVLQRERARNARRNGRGRAPLGGLCTKQECRACSLCISIFSAFIGVWIFLVIQTDRAYKDVDSFSHQALTVVETQVNIADNNVLVTVCSQPVWNGGTNICPQTTFSCVMEMCQDNIQPTLEDCAKLEFSIGRKLTVINDGKQCITEKKLQEKKDLRDWLVTIVIYLPFIIFCAMCR